MPPLEFNAWDRRSNTMYLWDNSSSVICSYIISKNPAIIILPWSGHIDDKGFKIFLNDICHVKVKNEFGSFLLLLVKMEYNDQKFFDFDWKGDPPMGSDIVSVVKLGNIYEHGHLANIGVRKS